MSNVVRRVLCWLIFNAIPGGQNVRLRELLANRLIRERIEAHLIEQGATPAAAAAEADKVTAGGPGAALKWLIEHAPQLYAFAQFIAALFGLPLPPLPIPPSPPPPPA